MTVLLAAFVLNPLWTMADETTVDQADAQNQAAQDWLDLAGQGKYKESWDSASAVVKDSITSAQWESSTASTIAQVGARLTRGLDGRAEVSAVPGLPDGEYVILTFSSSFANKATAVEKLTLKKDADGTWRTAAYSIQ